MILQNQWLMLQILESFYSFFYAFQIIIFYFSNVPCLHLLYYSPISDQLSLPNNHNHLFDKFSCFTLNPILFIFLDTDLTMLFPWKTSTTSTLSPTVFYTLLNCSVRFSKASKVWSWPNVYPTWRLLTTVAHTQIMI